MENPRKVIKPSSSWNLPPTAKQARAIAKLAQILGYHEPVEETVATRLEARNIIMGFREELKRRKANVL